MENIISRLSLWALVVANVFLNIFGLPLYTTTALDMSRFNDEPVFCDEFDGDTIDTSLWRIENSTSMRRGGYWNGETASVYDGALHMKTAYYENGIGDGPAGWYSTQLTTNGTYEQKYGYFECRCILPEGTGLWGAFWMLCKSMSDETLGGVNGAEIDVMESPYYSLGGNRKNVNASTIHIDGYADAHKSKATPKYRIDGDPYSEFHTYGVEWNEDGYTFYIDGKKAGFTDFGGASQVSEYMLLSVEVGGNDGIPDESWAGASIEENGRDFVSDFVVDYVKCWQYK